MTEIAKLFIPFAMFYCHLIIEACQCGGMAPYIVPW